MGFTPPPVTACCVYSLLLFTLYYCGTVELVLSSLLFILRPTPTRQSARARRAVPPRRALPLMPIEASLSPSCGYGGLKVP